MEKESWKESISKIQQRFRVGYATGCRIQEAIKEARQFEQARIIQLIDEMKWDESGKGDFLVDATKLKSKIKENV